jgi:predicted Ser/Thr protein kinase
VPRKTWIEAEKQLLRDDRKVALQDYERAEKTHRENTVRLQALRLAREAEEQKAQAEEAEKKPVKKKGKAAKPKARAGTFVPKS